MASLRKQQRSHYDFRSFQKVLIANRGEIACRIARTAKAMGYRTVAVFSDADAPALHVRMADEAVRIGPASPAGKLSQYSGHSGSRAETGADAIHPGYGFLAENADFARLASAPGSFSLAHPEMLSARWATRLRQRPSCKLRRVLRCPAIMATIRPISGLRPRPEGSAFRFLSRPLAAVEAGKSGDPGRRRI